MSDCARLKNYLNGETVTSDEKPALIKHMKECSLCHTEIQSHGFKLLDVVLLLIAEEKMTDDPPHDASYFKAKEKIYASIVKQTRIGSSQVVPKENRLVEFVRNCINPKILTPTVLAIGLMLFVSPYFKETQKSTILPESFRSKSGEKNLRLSLYDFKTRKEIEDGGILKMNDVAFFRYSLTSGAWLSLIHYHENKITIMKHPTLEGEGVLKDLGWEFTEPGEHYFIASVSKELSPLTELLKTGGISALLKEKQFKGEIKKVVIQNF